MKTGLSFITLLAFDYRYAFDAILSYYELADEILLGLDRDRQTWMGRPFDIDMGEVHEFMREFDSENKVRIVEGNYHGSEDPMFNETAERCELSAICTEGNWIVQIDSDEILLNAEVFGPWLEMIGTENVVEAHWVSVFKQFDDCALVVSPATETVPVATKLRGGYQCGRSTKQTKLVSPLNLLHYSWGRRPEELKQKLANWSHARDFDTEGFFKMWDSVTLENYGEYHDFHPIQGPLWRALSVVALPRIY